MQEPKTNGNVVLIVLVVLLVVLLTATSATAAYFYARSQSPAVTSEVTDEPVKTFLNDSSGETPPSGPVAPEKSVLPVVVFEPNGLFNDNLKQEMRDRIVDPFILYNDTEYNRQNKYNPVSIKISVNNNSDTKASYPYLFESISQNGGTTGFVITVKDGKVSYYVPECMVKCDFTEEFKTKYPEIVALANP